MNILEVLEDLTEGISKHGEVYRSACPIHKGSNKTQFVVFTETNSYFCHTCGERGDMIDLIMKTQKCSEAEALKQVNLESRPKIKHEIHERDKSSIDFTLENNHFLSEAGSRAKELFDELINPEALKEANLKLLSGLIGYDSVNDTLTVAIKDNDRVVQVKRRKLGEKKWVGLKGSDGSFSAKRLTGKPYVFLASGMAEYIILQAIRADYIVLQSDQSKFPDINLADKVVIVLEDNDKKKDENNYPSFLRDGLDNSLVNQFKIKVTNRVESQMVIPIDFENVLDMQLPKGYDFRDFINENPTQWGSLLDREISLWINNYKTLTERVA